MRTMHKRNSFWTRSAFVLLALCLPWLALAAPRAWLDRDSIRLGETVTLNVETDARGGSEPDFAPLDADFERVGTSSSTQLSWVNGKQSARTLWAVALDPRREGTIPIPALAVGADRTAPLTLTVLPMPTGGSAAAGDEVFLEVEAEPVAPYVQQQVRYVVRLNYAVTLLEGQLDEPQVAGAQLRRLGQDVQYQTTLSGQRYNVVERRYALMPEASGPLVIPGPQFRGRALRPGSFGMRGNAVLTARGNEIALDVRPRPAPASGPWLPARSLRLQDESAALPATLAVGEPITLTLRLSAQGLSAEQLPELVLPRIEGAEVYPDQDSSQTRDDGQWLLGERVRKFAIVPSRPGTLRIPEVVVDWWDIGNDRRARASLAARELSITAGAGAVAPAAPTPASTVAAPADSQVPDPGEAAAAPSGSTAGWWPVATLVFAALWLLTLFWRRRRGSAVLPLSHDAGPERIGANAMVPAPALRRALQGEDATAIAQSLLALARNHDSHCRNLGDLAASLADESQREAIVELERALYREAPDAAMLARLRAAFATAPRWRGPVAPPGSGRDALPPLYRSSR